MSAIRNTLHVHVSYNTEDEEYGGMYIASCEEISLVTEGKTLDTLLVNLKEAISLHLDGLDTVAEFNLTPNPRVMLNIELPEDYAKTA